MKIDNDGISTVRRRSHPRENDCCFMRFLSEYTFVFDRRDPYNPQATLHLPFKKQLPHTYYIYNTH